MPRWDRYMKDLLEEMPMEIKGEKRSVREISDHRADLTSVSQGEDEEGLGRKSLRLQQFQKGFG